ncbi:MAG: septum formation initiator family protein, partial [Clostridia bacterium]|nr:septum formation initiator family protein [Clostridia bacterium]
MKKILNKKFLLGFISVCLIVFSLVTIISLKIRINDLDEKKAQLTDEREAIKRRIEEIKYELDRPIDDEYIIKVARERLGYHLPGEEVYV